MTESRRTEDRDEVLFAFHQECARPTSEQIVAWARKFPDYAEDIRAHAAVAWDWATQDESAVEVSDENLCARAYSQALNIIFNSENPAAAMQSGASGQTFQEMLRQSGREVYQLARELDIDRGVLADLFNGWMLRPACNRLVDSIMASFNITHERFDSAFKLALQSPHLGHAKADRTPMVKVRSCAEIIQDSNMSEERKRYWLDEKR